MIPNQKPFVCDCTFLDGKGPPPYEFFDETQDGIAAAQHALTGWRWASHQEDFATRGLLTPFRFGDFRYTGLNNRVAVNLATSSAGVAGEIRVFPDVAGLPMSLRATSGESAIGENADYLLSARVVILARESLQPAQNFGFWVGMGDSDLDNMPGICCGGDLLNWQVSTPLGAGLGRVLVDTGIAAQNGRYYNLQLCRRAGVRRYFVNGTPVRLPTPDRSDLRDGVFLPKAIPHMQRLLLCNQQAAGANTGFRVDFFHALIQRVL